MEFGKLESVDSVNWDLHDEDPLTHDFLASLGPQNSGTRFYIGSPAWGRKEWVGRLYPPKTPASEFLHHYSRNFNCIELNTTHYRIPTAAMVSQWRSQVPSEFLFCPKLPQTISHDPGGLRNTGVLAEWLKALGEFGENLGPCFVQLSPYFTYQQKAELFHFLQAWPSEFDLTLELRHPSWFEGGRILPALVSYLQKRRIGLVITDVAGRRDVLHMSISSDFSMLRFIGNDLHQSDFRRSREWALRIAKWQELGLRRFFFMVHEPDDIKTPEMAEHVIRDLNEVCAAGLQTMARPLI